MRRTDDLKLIGALLAISLVLLAGAKLLKKPGTTVVITLDGKEVVREELKAGSEWKIENPGGGYNLFIVEEGEDGRLGIRCLEADCPEQICVNKGFVSLTDDPVVCLPHRVTAKLIDE